MLTQMRLECLFFIMLCQFCNLQFPFFYRRVAQGYNSPFIKL